MINFEKYREQLFKLATEYDTPAAVFEEEIWPCTNTSCEKCQFYSPGKNCRTTFLKWLFEEYEEKPKLTERAYHFLKALPNNVKIMYTNGVLYMDVGKSIVTTQCHNNKFVPALPLKPDRWYEVSELLKREVNKDE